MTIRDVDLSSKLQFKTSRSGGKGGQNVNKLDTKVEVHFDIGASALLSESQKSRLLDKLKSKLSSEGILRVVSTAERSQLANKKKCVEKLYDLLEEALNVPKKRKPTKPSRAAVQKRLTEKKKLSEKKKGRKDTGDE